MKLSQLKIDPEFQSKIPPLQFEEEQQLEQNIIAEGRLLNPIITWNGYILDGHTRYRILKKHGFIKFEVEEIQFANKYEALAWICKNQLGRRNLSPERKKFLLGKEYESTKLAVGGQPGNCNKVNRCDQNDHIDADMEPHIGSEQGGKRPVVVLQNNIGNRHSPTLIVATVTTRTEKKKKQPTHVLVDSNPAFEESSMILLEQIFTIDKSRIERFMGYSSKAEMLRIDMALLVSLALNVLSGNRRGMGRTRKTGRNRPRQLCDRKNRPSELPHMAEARIAAGGDRYYQRNLQTQRTLKARLAAEPINKAPRSTYAFLFWPSTVGFRGGVERGAFCVT